MVPFDKGEYRDITLNEKIVMGDPETFKDSRNVGLTKGLFLELYVPYQWNRKGIQPYFTLKDFDYGPFKSLRKIYMEIGDRTEYKFAMAVFGSFEYWNNIAQQKDFKPHLEVWRHDLEASMKADAFEVIKTIATQVHKPTTALQAAKFLLQEEWKTEGKTKRITAKEAKEKQKELIEEQTVGTINHDEILKGLQRPN